MKDNEKNLNNELNDDEMEAVAGGGEKMNWKDFETMFMNSLKKAHHNAEVYRSIFNNSTPQ